jgi:peptide/nickel transport system permease protein
LLGISIVTFAVLNLLPGNAARQLLGADATPLEIEKVESLLGLDEPMWHRYGKWVSGAARGNWGTSLANGQAVSSLISERLFVTLELALLATVSALFIAVFLALIGTLKPGGTADKIIFALSMALLSVPSYVLALLLVLALAVYAEILPSIGYVPISEGLTLNLRALALPTAAIALPLAGLYGQFLRNDIVEQLTNEDYILTARNKGLSQWQILTRHALRNSIPGLLTLAATHFGALVGGTVLIEQVFGLPGIGQLLFQATSTRDAPVVQAIVLLLAVFTVLANLTIDIICTFLDPRIEMDA